MEPHLAYWELRYMRVHAAGDYWEFRYVQTPANDEPCHSGRWQWRHGKEPGATLQSDPIFNTFEDCVLNAQEYGFPGNTNPDDYEWTRRDGFLTAVVDPDQSLK